MSLQHYLKEFKGNLQGEVESSDIKEIIKKHTGDFSGSQLTGGDLTDVAKNAASSISSFGIGIGLSLLGVFLAKKYKKSRAAKAIAKILGTDVEAMDRGFVVQKLLNDKTYFARVQRSIVNVLSSKEHDFNKVIDVFVEEFKEFGLTRDEALEIYMQIKDILLDGEIVGTIWRVSNATSQLETKLGLEANSIRKAIDEQANSFKTSMDGMLTQVFAKIDHNFTEFLTRFNLSQSNLRLITSFSEFGEGDRNCWKDVYFSYADIKNEYDARRPVTDDIIKSIESQGVLIYGDPYVGKSILVKRVMLEMANKGYGVIYSSGTEGESNPYHVKDLLTSLSKTYPKILFVADDAHEAANESFFEVFNELYGTSAEKSIRFLFAAREKQLEKQKPVIERALRKIPKESQFHIGFSLDDALMFLQQAFKVTHGIKIVPTDAINMVTKAGKNLYELSEEDPFMFSLGIKYVLEGRGQKPENLVTKEMDSLIKKIEEIERGERIQNRELMKAAVISAIMSIAHVMVERNSHPKLFTCSRIPHVIFQTLLQNNILLKESHEGKIRVRHEMFSYEFLSFLYENKFHNDPEWFNEDYGHIVKCIWDNIGVNEIIDMLSTCSYLYFFNYERYRPISKLITVPLDQYSPPPGIDDSDKVKLFCYGLGNFYYNIQDPLNAVKYYDKALELNPNDAGTLNNKGNALAELGKHEEAVNYYDKALELNPNDAGTLSNKGNALRKLGKKEEAIKYYDKALELNPNDAGTLSNKGNALAELGKHEEAIEYFDKALELNPNYADARLNKGSALVGLGRYQEAINYYDKAIELNPNDAVVWYNKGNALAELGKKEEAIKYYDKALELNPKYADIWYNKGNALVGLGRYQEAIECYDKAIELNPNYLNARLNKGLVLVGLGRVKEAIECYDKAIELKPDDADVWYHKGKALHHHLGKYEEAINCFDKAIEIEPTKTNAFYNKGLVLVKLGKHEEAINYYDKAIELNPNNTNAWLRKGSALVGLGRYQEAINYYDKAIELNPKYADVWNVKAFLLAELGKHEEALKGFSKVTELNPNYADAWNNKGQALLYLGKYEEAINCFDKAIELDPNNASAWYNRACSKVKKDNIENGLADLKKAIELDKKYIELAKQEKDFESIRSDERLTDLIMK